MWTDGNGFFYEGDCRLGDRAATEEEVATWQAERAAALVPDWVSNFQGRTALRLAGIFQQVSDAIDALPDETQRAIAQDAFRRGDFHRDSDLLNQILVTLGHDTAYRDALFVQAAAIKV